MSALNDKIKEINTLYAKAMSLLASNRQKLLALQPRLKTQEQKARFQKLVGARKNMKTFSGARSSLQCRN